MFPTHRDFLFALIIIVLLLLGCNSDFSDTDGDLDGFIDGDLDSELELDIHIPDGDTNDSDVESADDENSDDDGACVESIEVDLESYELHFTASNTIEQQFRKVTLSANSPHKINNLAIYDDDEKPEFSIITDNCTDSLDTAGI